ncbi:MAG: penicillin acylase family protein [Candidatus Actinomarina sp.]|nr:penicillin acylase family protein [Candidatus Actinomarina sp.]
MKKFFKWVLVSLIGLQALIIIAGIVIFRMPLPDHEIDVTGLPLSDFVEVIRDERGIPHIYGTNIDDILFAQGYVHAQDRFWQLEFWSHLSTGRLASLIGEPGVGADLLFRTFGFHKVALEEYENLEPEFKNDLINYTAGINAYIESRPQNRLSLEHFVLQFLNPEYVVGTYEPHYPLAWAKMMAYDLNGNFTSEISNSKTFNTLSPEIYNLLIPPYPEEHPYIVEEWEGRGTFVSTGKANNFQQMTQSFFIKYVTKDMQTNQSLGSNSWVVDGTLTDTGLPLLANDPHLSVQLPAIWYENGLHCFPKNRDCQLDTVGFSFAGSPYVIIGYNSDIAWGLTNMGPDVQDLFIEKINPGNENQYQVDDEWIDMQRTTEIIEVAGSDPIVIEVRETHHGPIVSDRSFPINLTSDEGESTFREEARIDLPDNFAVSLSWSALIPGETFVGIRDFNYASNWEEFREATKKFHVPAQNLLYADRDGNIGYQSPGKLPIRRDGLHGDLPIEGWLSENDWQGFVDFEELPYTLNPSSGYIITANQSVHPDQPWPNYYARGYRAEAIERVINQYMSGKISVDDMQAMQINNFDYSAAYVLPYVFNNVYIDSQVLTELKEWAISEEKFEMNIESTGAAAWAVFYKTLAEQTFEELVVFDNAGNEISLQPGNSDSTSEIFRTLLKDPNHIMWDDVNTSGKENLTDILERTLSISDKTIVEIFDSSDSDDWEWGKIHTITYPTNLLGEAGIPILTGLVNIGPVETSGSNFAINSTDWGFGDDFTIGSYPSMRMVVDLSNLDNSRTVLPSGQSGHVMSKYYDDQVDNWIENDMYANYFSREIVELNQKDLMYLRP